jgi:signal transduction histidine kinase
MRDYLRQLLRDWTVETAGDGRTALEQARANPPALIVTDVMMPGLDGFELLRELRADVRTKAIPILMLSARAGEEARISGLDAGADDYVIKPFSARELTARVASLLNLSRARREAELQRALAEAANRTKDQFLAMLGHELRNPLAPILTALRLMTLKGGDTLLKERTIVERQVRHLVRLVDDLLDVSRIARGKIELRRQSVDMADIIASAVEAASPLLEERQHQLAVNVPRGLAVNGDPTRLTQVVTNVVSNAAKYTPSGGRIEIVAVLEHDAVEVRIRDNGMGVSAEMLPHIFEMFTQERQALHRADGGLGLGLTIVKSLVELHRGTVMARSEGIGRGCEIVVRLPKAVPAAVKSDVHVARGPAVAPRLGRRVLIVDDNVDAARTMADALDLAGYDTRVSFDGPAALDASASFEPDAVLLDLGLPLMDGYEVARELMAGPSDRRPILVALTGYGQLSDQERTRTAGFNSHLVKPIDPPQLITVLERLLTPEPAN